MTKFVWFLIRKFRKKSNIEKLIDEELRKE